MKAGVPPPTRYPKNLDVKCLRCGAVNIPENKICGNCGASLPLVYDEEGKVFNWTEDPSYKAVLKKTLQPRSPNPNQVRWLLRFIVLLAAFLSALYIMRRH